jgi:hypothetical protein
MRFRPVVICGRMPASTNRSPAVASALPGENHSFAASRILFGIVHLLV